MMGQPANHQMYGMQGGGMPPYGMLPDMQQQWRGMPREGEQIGMRGQGQMFSPGAVMPDCYGLGPPGMGQEQQRWGSGGGMMHPCTQGCMSNYGMNPN